MDNRILSLLSLFSFKRSLSKESRLTFSEAPQDRSSDQAADVGPDRSQLEKDQVEALEKRITARKDGVLAEAADQKRLESAGIEKSITTRDEETALQDFDKAEPAKKKETFDKLLNGTYEVGDKNLDIKSFNFTPEDFTKFMQICESSVENKAYFMTEIAKKIIDKSLSAYHVNKNSLRILFFHFDNSPENKATLKSIFEKISEQSATRTSELIELVMETKISEEDQKQYLSFIPPENLKTLIDEFAEKFSAEALISLMNLGVIKLEQIIDKITFAKKAEILKLKKLKTTEATNQIIKNLTDNIDKIINEDPKVLETIVAYLAETPAVQTVFLKKTFETLVKTPDLITKIPATLLKTILNQGAAEDALKPNSALIKNLSVEQKTELVRIADLNNDIGKEIFKTLTVDEKLNAAGFEVEGKSIIFYIPNTEESKVKRSFKKSFAADKLEELTNEEVSVKVALDKVKLAVYKRLLELVTKDGSINTDTYDLGNGGDDFRKSNAQLAFEVAQLEASIAKQGQALTAPEKAQAQDSANLDLAIRTLGGIKKHKTFDVTESGVKTITPSEAPIPADQIDTYLEQVYDEMQKLWGRTADPFTKEAFIAVNNTPAKTTNRELLNGTTLTLPFISIEELAAPEAQLEATEKKAEDLGYVEVTIGTDEDAKILQSTETFKDKTIESLIGQELFVDAEGKIYLPNSTEISEPDATKIKGIEDVNHQIDVAKRKAKSLGLVLIENTGNVNGTEGRTYSAVYVDGSGNLYLNNLGARIPEADKAEAIKSIDANPGIRANREKAETKAIEQRNVAIQEEIKTYTETVIQMLLESTGIDISKIHIKLVSEPTSPTKYEITTDNSPEKTYIIEFSYDPTRIENTIKYRWYRKNSPDTRYEKEFEDWVYQSQKTDDYEVKLEKPIDTKKTEYEGDIIEKWNNFENREMVTKVLTSPPFNVAKKDVPTVAAAIITEGDNTIVTMDDILDVDMLKLLKIDETNIPRELITRIQQSSGMGEEQAGIVDGNEFRRFIEKYNSLGNTPQDLKQKQAIKELVIGGLKLMEAFTLLRYNKTAVTEKSLDTLPAFKDFEEPITLGRDILKEFVDTAKVADFQKEKGTFEASGIILPEKMTEMNELQKRTLGKSAKGIQKSFQESRNAYDISSTISGVERDIQKAFPGLEGDIQFKISNILTLKFNKEKGFYINEATLKGNFIEFTNLIQEAKLKTMSDEYEIEEYKARTLAQKSKYEREQRVEKIEREEIQKTDTAFDSLIKKPDESTSIKLTGLKGAESLLSEEGYQKLWPAFEGKKVVEEIMLSSPLNVKFKEEIPRIVAAAISEYSNMYIDMDDLLDQNILSLFNIDRTGLPAHLFTNNIGALSDWRSTYERFSKEENPKSQAIAEKMKVILVALLRLRDAIGKLKYNHDTMATGAMKDETIKPTDAYKETPDQKRTVASLKRMFAYLKQLTGDDYSEEEPDALHMGNLSEGGDYIDPFRNYFNPESAAAIILEKASREEGGKLIIDNEKLANTLNTLIIKGYPVIIRNKAIQALKEEEKETTQENIAAKEKELTRKYPLVKIEGSKIPASLEQICGTDERSALSESAEITMQALKYGFVIDELAQSSALEGELDRLAGKGGEAIKRIDAELLAQGLSIETIKKVNAELTDPEFMSTLVGGGFITVDNGQATGGGGSLNIPLADGYTLTVFGGLKGVSEGGIAGTVGLSLNIQVYKEGRTTASISPTISIEGAMLAGAVSHETNAVTVTAFLGAGFSWTSLGVPVVAGLDFSWSKQAETASVEANLEEAKQDSGLKEIWEKWGKSDRKAKEKMIQESTTVKKFVADLKSTYPEVFKGTESTMTNEDYDYVIALIDSLIRNAKDSAIDETNLGFQNIVTGLTVAGHVITAGTIAGAAIGGPLGAMLGAGAGFLAGIKFKVYEKTIFIPSRTQKAQALRAFQEAGATEEIRKQLELLEKGESPLANKIEEQTGRLFFDTQERSLGFIKAENEFKMSKYFSRDYENLNKELDKAEMRITETKGKMLELEILKSQTKDIEISIDPAIKLLGEESNKEERIGVIRQGNKIYLDGAVHRLIITRQRVFFPRPQGVARSNIKDVITIRLDKSVEAERTPAWIREHSGAQIEKLWTGKYRTVRGLEGKEQDSIIDIPEGIDLNNPDFINDQRITKEVRARLLALRESRPEMNREKLDEIAGKMDKDYERMQKAIGTMSEKEFEDQLLGLDAAAIEKLSRFFHANYGALEKIIDKPAKVMDLISKSFKEFTPAQLNQAYRYILYKYFVKLYPGTAAGEEKETSIKLPEDEGELDLNKILPGSFIIETYSKIPNFEVKISNSFHAVILDTETNTAFLCDHDGEVIRSYPAGRTPNTLKQKRALAAAKSRLEANIRKTIDANKKVIRGLESHRDFEKTMFVPKFQEAARKLREKGIKLNTPEDKIGELVNTFYKNIYDGLIQKLTETDPPTDYRTIVLNPMEEGGLFLSGTRTRESAGERTKPTLAGLYVTKESTTSPEFPFGNGLLSLGPDYENSNSYDLNSGDPERADIARILHEIASPLPVKPKPKEGAETVEKDENIKYYRELLTSPLATKILGSKGLVFLLNEKEYQSAILFREAIKESEEIKRPLSEVLASKGLTIGENGEIPIFNILEKLITDIRNAQLENRILRRRSRREGTRHTVEFDFTKTMQIEGGAYSKCGNPSFYVNERGTIRVYETGAPMASRQEFTEMTESRLAKKIYEFSFASIISTKTVPVGEEEQCDASDTNVGTSDTGKAAPGIE